MIPPQKIKLAQHHSIAAPHFEQYLCFSRNKLILVGHRIFEDKALPAELKGLAQAEIIKNQWVYFGLIIWPYNVNMSIE